MGACEPLGYTPRQTATSDLVGIVAQHLPAFLERVERDGGTLPAFVTEELEGLLRCGDFEHGFVQLCCTRCGDELRVAFSCKGRGICQSCIGRRMCETAANWVDGLLPAVPYRQWVLSFDSSLAVRLGYDSDALGVVCRSWTRRVMQRIAGRVKQEHGLASVAKLHPGLVTVVQRFRADAGLFVHLHTLATDGAFEELPGGGVRFHPATTLTDDDLLAVLDRVAADLAKAGLADDTVDLDVQPALAACVQLSLSSPTPATLVSAPPRLVVRAHGMNLHAATVVDGRDRRRLERVCKYLLRPPFSAGAVHRLPDGRVRLDLPRKGRCVTMSPEQFLAKLVALVPPPHFNLVRYAGVFANRHHLRTQIVPTPTSPVPDASPHQLGLFDIHRKPRPPRTVCPGLGRPRTNASPQLVVAAGPRLRHRHHRLSSPRLQRTTPAGEGRARPRRDRFNPSRRPCPAAPRTTRAARAAATLTSGPSSRRSSPAVPWLSAFCP